MTPRFRPNPDLQTGIRANRRTLDTLLDHNTRKLVEGYAEYVTRRKIIDLLDTLQRRIDGWADDADHNQDVDPKPLRDTAEHLRDLLREAGAEEVGQ